MFITTSNILKGITPVIIDGAGINQEPVNLLDSDHSTNYTSAVLTNVDALEVSFGALSAKYVAVSGHNINSNVVSSPEAIQEGNTIEIYDGATFVARIDSLNRNNVFFFLFESGRTFSNMILKFKNTGQDAAFTISYIAAGDVFEVPNNGEQSGYARNIFGRSTNQAVNENSQAMPIAITKKRSSLRGNLSIPNSPVDLDFEYMHFMDYAELEPFFIIERIGGFIPASTSPVVSSRWEPSLGYICYNPQLAIKSHSSTRLLNSVSLRFQCNNGL
tara:strand:+ start:1853 stop:2674 length:822 start_codon:yes stop_codon:yes gene_type:complete